LLTVKEAAQRADVCVALVYGWCQSGVLAHLRLGGQGRRGCIRIEEADLQAFLAGQKREGRQDELPPPKRKQKSAFRRLSVP